jgi:hypothetical protein
LEKTFSEELSAVTMRRFRERLGREENGRMPLDRQGLPSARGMPCPRFTSGGHERM